MTREVALLLMLALAVVLVVLGMLAWRRRGRRDAGIAAPVGEAPAGAVETLHSRGLYVATTRHGDPLERLAIRGLAFRSRVAVTVTDRGVALDLTGQPRVFLDAARITDVAQATVAIDRVVERDGLVRVTWTADSGDTVDSYLRPQDLSAKALADAISAIGTAEVAAPSPTPSTTPQIPGSDA